MVFMGIFTGFRTAYHATPLKRPHLRCFRAPQRVICRRPHEEFHTSIGQFWKDFCICKTLQIRFCKESIFLEIFWRVLSDSQMERKKKIQSAKNNFLWKEAFDPEVVKMNENMHSKHFFCKIRGCFLGGAHRRPAISQPYDSQENEVNHKPVVLNLIPQCSHTKVMSFGAGGTLRHFWPFLGILINFSPFQILGFLGPFQLFLLNLGHSMVILNNSHPRKFSGLQIQKKAQPMCQKVEENGSKWTITVEDQLFCQRFMTKKIAQSNPQHKI